MTLSDLRAQILTHFLNNTTLFLSDITRFKVDVSLDKLKKEIIIEAMKAFEKEHLVSQIHSQEGILIGWILENKIGNSGQTVHLSYYLSHAIADTINSFMKANNIKNEDCDPLNLSEKDIGALIGIINEVLNEKEEDDHQSV